MSVPWNLSNRKEWDTDTSNSRRESQEKTMLSEVHQTSNPIQRKLHSAWFHLHKIVENVYSSIFTDSRSIVARWWRGQAERKDPERNTGKLWGMTDMFLILITLISWMYTYNKTYKEYTLNICSSLSVNYTSVKLLKITTVKLPLFRPHPQRLFHGPGIGPKPQYFYRTPGASNLQSWLRTTVWKPSTSNSSPKPLTGLEIIRDGGHRVEEMLGWWCWWWLIKLKLS